MHRFLARSLSGSLCVALALVGPSAGCSSSGLAGAPDAAVDAHVAHADADLPEPDALVAELDGGADAQVPTDPDAGPPADSCFDAPITIAMGGGTHPSRSFVSPLGLVPYGEGWLAIYDSAGGEHVAVLDASGRLVRTLEIPDSYVFGGGAFDGARAELVGGDVLVLGSRIQRLRLVDGATAVDPSDGWAGSLMASRALAADRVRVLDATWDGVTAGLDVVDLEITEATITELSRASLAVHTVGPRCAFAADGASFECVEVLRGTEEGSWRYFRGVLGADGGWTIPEDGTESGAPGAVYRTIEGARLALTAEWKDPGRPDAVFVESTPGSENDVRARVLDGVLRGRWIDEEVLALEGGSTAAGGRVRVVARDTWTTLVETPLDAELGLDLSSQVTRRGDEVAVLYVRSLVSGGEPELGIRCVRIPE